MTDPTSDGSTGELHDRVVSGEAWNERSESDLDRAEGFRFPSRLTRGGLASFVEGGDIRFPIIRTCAD